MIFIMIAGSYTPVCLIALHNRIGYILCGLVWTIAILGILLKGLWINCPKWLSSVLYIGMGWLCVLAFVPIFHSLPRAGFGWLLAGGIIYTIGGVIYGLKLPLFNARHQSFGSHEIFHVFHYAWKCLPFYCNVFLYRRNAGLMIKTGRHDTASFPEQRNHFLNGPAVFYIPRHISARLLFFRTGAHILPENLSVSASLFWTAF